MPAHRWANGGRWGRAGVAAVLFGLWVLWAGSVRAQEDLRVPLNDAGVFDPEQGPLAIRYTLLKDAEEVVVDIRGVKGQVVRQERRIALLAGDHLLTWDGRDANGDRLPEGPYELTFAARFEDGTRGRSAVATRIAALPPLPGVPPPELLPPEAHAYRISGSISSIWRHDGETHEDAGQFRMQTRFAAADDTRRAEGVLAVIDTYPGGDTDWDASQAFVEQRWQEGRIRGVFREGLGAFDDPVKLFSDFKSERRKIGFRVDQGSGLLQATGLAFTTEGDVDAETSGAAARLRWGEEDGWLLGAGFTHREALERNGEAVRGRNQAMAADLRVPVVEPLAVLAEWIHTEDTEKSGDNGYAAMAVYDGGRLRLSTGYIDLGEDFAADFADPLHGVTSDARGFEAGLDYALPVARRWFENPIATLRLFDLKRHSDGETLRELDASLRFAAGDRDSIFLNWYGQKGEDGATHTFLGTATHRWNPRWATALQVNRVEGEESGTWRFTLDTTYHREVHTARAALEWIRRTIDGSALSPFEETSLRLDWDNQRWGLQAQLRYSENAEDRGINAFGRIEHRRELLHRYQVIAYASLGSRSAMDFAKRVEVGVEWRF